MIPVYNGDTTVLPDSKVVSSIPGQGPLCGEFACSPLFPCVNEGTLCVLWLPHTVLERVKHLCEGD